MSNYFELAERNRDLKAKLHLTKVSYDIKLKDFRDRTKSLRKLMKEYSKEIKILGDEIEKQILADFRFNKKFK